MNLKTFFSTRIPIITSLMLVAFLAFKPIEPDKAPNFTLKNAKGATVTLTSLKGKVVVVNFWATWCGPCRAEIPGFLDVYAEYKSKGLEIVGISLDRDGWDVINPFVEKYKITYPVVLGDERTVRNYGGINAIPTTFIVDRNGNIAVRHIGYMNKTQLLTAVKGLL